MDVIHEGRVYTRKEIAEWLKVEPRQVDRLGVPALNLPGHKKTRLYFGRDVLAWLESVRPKAVP